MLFEKYIIINLLVAAEPVVVKNFALFVFFYSSAAFYPGLNGLLDAEIFQFFLDINVVGVRYIITETWRFEVEVE